MWLREILSQNKRYKGRWEWGLVGEHLSSIPKVLSSIFSIPKRKMGKAEEREAGYLTSRHLLGDTME